MKIAGLWSGHDCSFCVLEDGKPLIHAEYERYNREKSPPGDSSNFMFDRYPEWPAITHFASVYPKKKLTEREESYSLLKNHIDANGGKLYFCSHHKAHAANAFYSSNFEKSIIVTLDGGGVEDDRGGESACTIWRGDGTELKHLKTFRPNEINIGGVWTRVTRYVFKLQNGWPRGGQEGSVMAMAAFGDASIWAQDCWNWLTKDKMSAGFKPPNQPVGATSDRDPPHPYLEPWAAHARESEQNRFDIAAGLQEATEALIRQIIEYALSFDSDIDSICLAGGVTLNSVAMGKLLKWFPQLKRVYIPPVPYDGGLCIGAAQALWHEELGNPRIKWEHNFTPYLGETWTEEHFNEVLENRKNDIEVLESSVEDIVSKLQEGNIVSVFNGSSESGRRALGNRSILVDPRSTTMKDTINEKVKHRQWYRPFAPSILESEASDWFEEYQESPYMQFVLKFKKEKVDLVPAVVHLDGTARLQTVRETDNKWYYDFLQAWHKASGVPIILNTSFNDREPICENVEHALNCFLGTNIDYLYFPEYKKLIKRKGAE